jgi:DNA-binding CsgD family transcriptional regulator
LAHDLALQFCAQDNLILKTVDGILLSLYAATTEVAPAEFVDFAMTLVQTALPFDSAVSASLDTRSGDMLVLGGDMFREPPSLLTEWQAVSQADPVVTRGLAQPGSSTAFHTPTLMQALEDRGMRDCLEDNPQHQNGVVMVVPASTPGLWEVAGVYRADADSQFSHAEMAVVEQLTPHLLQAIKINRRVVSVGDAAVGAPAIAALDGHLRYAAQGLIGLLRSEWPAWRGDKLPAELMAALRASPALRYEGERIEAGARLSGEVLILQVKPLSALTGLSAREATAAKLYGAGMSTKEIARQMHISPNTVRNFIQRVYKKLNVNDKAALAVALASYRDVR